MVAGLQVGWLDGSIVRLIFYYRKVTVRWLHDWKVGWLLGCRLDGWMVGCKMVAWMVTELDCWDG